MNGMPFMVIFWYIFPVVLLFASDFVVQTLSLTRRFNIKSPDIATPFLLMGIQALSSDTYQKSAVPYVVILMLLVGISVALGHAYYYGDIQYKRFFKIFWRIVFLLTFVLYFLLILLNIFSYL